MSYVAANNNITSITSNRNFWKTDKPVFSDQISHKERLNFYKC